MLNRFEMLPVLFTFFEQCEMEKIYYFLKDNHSGGETCDMVPFHIRVAGPQPIDEYYPNACALSL